MAKSDDRLFEQIRNLGEASKAARDQSLAPELRALARDVAEKAMDDLKKDKK
ncbi:hypothetical protein [Streptomyces sp. NPDC059398]|uniref:hypothetical protein n=1 Tax=Streptomyces sp. NPDC059398 TaxID=3346820 RepID=UPI0036A25863